MNKYIFFITFILILLAYSQNIYANEISGFISLRGQYFLHEPAYSNQEKEYISVALEPEYYHDISDRVSFTLKPFGRVDKSNSRLTHFDIREFSILYNKDTWELNIGLSKVFWGTTEFVHLVDVINQTDTIESFDGEEKLGQPMVYLSIPDSWGIFDVFILPFFREQTFPDKKNRLRSNLLISNNNTEYESSSKEQNIDFALRYSHSISIIDFGIYHFKGTSREPTIKIGTINTKSIELKPYYPQINQTGLDAQVVAGEWLIKFEGINRSGLENDFFAAVGGFEFSFYGLADSAADIGIISEYSYDDRGRDSTSAFQNDVMLGLRLSLNDKDSTELLTGLFRDLDNQTLIAGIEGSRRIGNNIKISLETRFFTNQPKDDPNFFLADEDFIQFEIDWYY